MTLPVILQITDYTTTVDIVSLGTESYDPGSSIRMTGASGTRSPTVLGVIRTLKGGETTDEVITCNLFDQPSIPNVYPIIRQIEFLSAEASEWQETKAGKRVWLLFAGDGGTVYRSEVVNGNVSYDESQLRINQASNITQFHIYVTRSSWFEQETEVQVPLLNGGASPKTLSAVTIYNHDDAGAGHDNWVQVAAIDAVGTMPAPVRIEFTDTTVTVRDDIVYMGVAQHGDPTAIPNVLEGETNTGASSQADVNCSAGYFGRFTTNTTFALKGVWQITAAQALALAGRYFRLVGRFKTLPSATTSVYFSTHITGGTTEQTTSQIATLSTSQYLQELGVLRLPPWLTAQTGLQSFDIGLNLKSTGSNNVDLDFIALFPTDGFRVAKFIDSGPTNTDIYVHDEIYPLFYMQTSGGKRTGNLSTYGEPLTIWPGKIQRYYFLTQDSTPAAPIATTHTVKLYYRPRIASM
jgi:hypothetical protein